MASFKLTRLFCQRKLARLCGVLLALAFLNYSCLIVTQNKINCQLKGFKVLIAWSYTFRKTLFASVAKQYAALSPHNCYGIFLFLRNLIQSKSGPAFADCCDLKFEARGLVIFAFPRDQLCAILQYIVYSRHPFRAYNLHVIF